MRAWECDADDVHLTRPAPIKAGPSSSSSRVLTFTSHAHFRHRLVLSILSRRPVRIDAIRPDDDQPGLHAYEVSFLRLLEKMTEGTRVEISYTGTSVLFHPGTLAGGTFTHQCPLDRSVGWYLEPLLGLAPFGKKDLVLTLKGITTNGRDASVDTIRTSGLPHLAMFLDKDGLELKVGPKLGDAVPPSSRRSPWSRRPITNRSPSEVIHHLEAAKSPSHVLQCGPSRADSISPVWAELPRFAELRECSLEPRLAPGVLIRRNSNDQPLRSCLPSIVQSPRCRRSIRSEPLHSRHLHLYRRISRRGQRKVSTLDTRARSLS